MIHRITIHFLILSDYAKRGVFPRYASSGQFNDLSVRVSTDDLKSLLNDADANSEIHAEWGNYPNLVFAYARFAKKAREMLRAVPANLDVGRDGKSAAANDI